MVGVWLCAHALVGQNHKRPRIPWLDQALTSAQHLEPDWLETLAGLRL